MWDGEMDETALKKVVKWCHRTNRCLGLCFEHSEMPLFTGPETLDLIKSKVESEEWHIANHACVMAVSANDPRLSYAIVMHVLASCNRFSCLEMEALYKEFFQFWREDIEREYGPLRSVNSDGDKSRRKCFHNLMSKPVSQISFDFTLCEP